MFDRDQKIKVSFQERPEYGGTIVVIRKDLDFDADIAFVISEDDRAALARMMDSLWALGVRPSSSMIDRENGAAAHLRDMRAIAFRSLKMEPPPEK